MENHANQNISKSICMSHIIAIIYSLQSDFLILFSEVLDPTDTLQVKTRSVIHSEGVMVKKLLKLKVLSGFCSAVPVKTPPVT
ncbi:hypothetical protein ANANG_G00316800, partial [Anguilla anguilla]